MSTYTVIDEVVVAVLTIAPTMREQDVKDAVAAVAADPSSAAILEADYRASNATVDPGPWATVWAIILDAASVASVVTSLGRVGTMVAGL